MLNNFFVWIYYDASLNISYVVDNDFFGMDLLNSKILIYFFHFLKENVRVFVCYSYNVNIKFNIHRDDTPTYLIFVLYLRT